MTGFWRLMARLYLKVPVSIRELPAVATARRHLQGLLVPHDAIYDREYYERDVEPGAKGSAPTMVDSILRDLRPESVVDLGCGTGALLAELQRRGCDVVGFDNAEAALAIAGGRGLSVRKLDIEGDPIPTVTCDVAVSFEVAEHLPERHADRFVELLTSLGRAVVFTAAPPGQGGKDHVNEQPRAYWLQKFRARGFECRDDLVQDWQAEWRASGTVASYYYENLMICSRSHQGPARS